MHCFHVIFLENSLKNKEIYSIGFTIFFLILRFFREINQFSSEEVQAVHLELISRNIFQVVLDSRFTTIEGHWYIL